MKTWLKWFVLGLVLALLGGFIMFFSRVVETPDGGVIGEIAWRPLVCILGANLLFGALLGGLPSIGVPSFGLVVAIFALTGVALLADAASFNLRRMLVLSGQVYSWFRDLARALIEP